MDRREFIRTADLPGTRGRKRPLGKMQDFGGFAELVVRHGAHGGLPLAVSMLSTRHYGLTPRMAISVAR